MVRRRRQESDPALNNTTLELLRRRIALMTRLRFPDARRPQQVHRVRVSEKCFLASCHYELKRDETTAPQFGDPPHAVDLGSARNCLAGFSCRNEPILVVQVNAKDRSSHSPEKKSWQLYEEVPQVRT